MAMFFSRNKYTEIKAKIVQRYHPELDKKSAILEYEDKVSLEGIYELHVVSESFRNL